MLNNSIQRELKKLTENLKKNDFENKPFKVYFKILFNHLRNLKFYDNKITINFS